MKRSEALAILSRDHHLALFVAEKLRRADDDTADTERARFLEFWTTGGGRRHFQLEEELLLPCYADYGDAYHPLVLRVLGDHVAIRARANRLAQRHEATPDELHELGAALSAHVRLEERQLFEIIEDAIPPDELLALARRLKIAEQEQDDDHS